MPSPSEGTDDRDHLLAENQELRQMVADLHAMLEEATAHQQPKPDFAQQQADYERLLDEKSDLIRSLHLKVQELQEKGSQAPLPEEEELRALAEDLERERSQMQQERRELDELRRQLNDDEQAMTQQMREMEVQMARERAELARQRSDLGRLQEEINRELERLARDNGLNERIGQLRQRFQDTTARRGAPPGPAAPPPAPPPAKEEGNPKKDSSLFRRLFG
jgi:chromosome segregation ATPase